MCAEFEKMMKDKEYIKTKKSVKIKSKTQKQLKVNEIVDDYDEPDVVMAEEEVSEVNMIDKI